MSSRFPPIPPSSLTPEQRKTYDQASSALDKAIGDKFIIKNEDGAFVGNFAPLLYTPDFMMTFIRYFVDLSTLPGFSPKAREVVILTLGHYFHAPYVSYSHQSQAAASGLSERQIEALTRGEKPAGEEGLDQAGQVAYEVTLEAVGNKGRLSKETWSRAERVLGKQGVSALIHYIGAYVYAGMIQNMQEVTAPVPGWD